MSDTCPKCDAAAEDYEVLRRLHLATIAHLERAEQQLAQLREQLAKAEIKELREQISHAIELLDGNENESDSPGGELIDKLVDHLEHYEEVKAELAKRCKELADAEWRALRFVMRNERLGRGNSDS